MWRCSSCGTGIEDKYAHCWQCGWRKESNRTRQNTIAAPKAVPGFASYEELAHVPSRPMWLFRRGPLQRLTFLFGILIIFKIVSAPFLGTYGLYIVVGVGVLSLVTILWRFFHRDPTDGVGIKLN